MPRNPDQFIKYNKILGKEASIGPVPANQLVPWLGLVLIAYTLTNGLFSLGLGWFFGLSFWLVVSWWMLTGSRPYRFLNQWRSPPGADWCNANQRYIPLLPSRRPRLVRQQYGDGVVRIKLKPRIVPTPQGGQQRFMPFQNEVNLCCLAEIKKDGREVSALLLEVGKHQYQFVFAFALEGLHDLLAKSEIAAIADAMEEGFKYLPAGERITFCTGCYSSDRSRQQELETLADTCQLTPISVLVRNEQKRVQELTQSGKRQIWKQYVFCTWTGDDTGEAAHKDWWNGVQRSWRDLSRSALGTITGNTRIYEEQFYKKLLLKAFSEGFTSWEMLLNTKVGLNLKPLKTEELWQWLWNRFNDEEAPPAPQVLSLEETEDGLKLSEQTTTDKHSVTVLIEGMQGQSACPMHQGQDDTIRLPGHSQHQRCGVLVMEEPPAGWTNTREQLRWVWKALSAGFVHDTEAWVEVSRANDYLIQDNLARQAKQSRSASTRALLKGQGRDIGAEVKQEESFDAQRQLYEGVKAVHCAAVFLVYRDSQRQLDLACQALSSNFDSAKVIREPHIAWELWLQTLPITARRLLQDNNVISSERRLTPTTPTLPGFLPITVPKDLNACGVEFLTDRGGKPIHIDLCTQEARRVLITGTSGSGKSVLGWRFAVDALAQNIPVVGMDISSGGDSTFKTAIRLLGDQGAYFDISRGSSNLLEPPDLRKFDKAERERRMESWKEMALYPLHVIAMGKVNNPQLSQRVEALLRLALDVFLRDPDIIDRYNRALQSGWKSSEWQQIPTLKDFDRYCTRERLNLRSFEELDRLALNQIRSQFAALFHSKIGRAIANPSSFSPEPAIKFFALSGLSNDGGQDAYLMAINAHAACIRNALSYPKSLFIGDELSVLLKRPGFAQMVGETCATGRKDGISVVLIAQDPDSICECATGAQIMQNMTYRITGRITAAAANSFQKYLNYDPSSISRNASEISLPKASELYSYWLVEKDGRFWTCRYYPGEMMLDSVANNQDEQAARARVMAQYPDTLIGNLEALAVFTCQYIPAIKEGKGLQQIGQAFDTSQTESFANEEYLKIPAIHL